MSNEIKKYFQAALNHVLKKKGYGAQSYYANKAGVNQQYISLIAKGDRKASETTRRKIAEAAGYEYEDFLTLGRTLLLSEEYGTDKVFRAAVKLTIKEWPQKLRDQWAKSANITPADFQAFIDGRKSLSNEQLMQLGSARSETNYEQLLRIGLDELGISPYYSSPEEQKRLRLLMGYPPARAPKEFIEGRTEDYRGVPLYESGRLATGVKGLVFDPYEEPASTVVIYRLELKGREGHDLRALRVGGDSMWPVIPQGSIVVVDLDDREFVDKKLYVIMQEEAGVMIAAVKRVRRSEQGFVILSENREYLPEITTVDWPDLCVGRVVWMWRSLEEA